MKIVDAVELAELTLVRLRGLAARHPELRLIRNPGGGYDICTSYLGYIKDWGFVDVFGEGVVLDGDWEVVISRDSFSQADAGD